MTRKSAAASRDGYLIEFHRIGHAVKVSAVDPASLVEVSIVGTPSAGEEELTRVAVRKLQYVLARRRNNGTSTS